MTKKDYIKFAEMFAFFNPNQAFVNDYSIEDLWNKLRGEVSDIFAADNPRFNRERFYAATEK